MSEGKERIVAEHPKAWVARMVEGRGLKVAEKTLYWWSVHLERFLKFCRIAGAGSSEIPEVAARLFLESLPVGGSAQDFAHEQARMALDVFIGEMVGWSWGEDRYGRVGPKFRLKTNSAGLTTEDTGGTERVLANDRVHGMESPWKSDGSASHPYPGVSLVAAAPRAERNQEALEAMRRALRVVLSREEVRRLLYGTRLDETNHGGHGDHGVENEELQFIKRRGRPWRFFVSV